MSVAEPLEESVTHLMRIPLADIPHLMQIPLTSKDLSILTGLQGWLSAAKFGETNSGSKICVDEKLREKWDLLCTMDYVQKV